MVFKNLACYFTGTILSISAAGFASDEQKSTSPEHRSSQNCDTLLKKDNGVILSYSGETALPNLGRSEWVCSDSPFQWQSMTEIQFDLEIANGYVPMENEVFSFQGKTLYASLASREETEWLSDVHFRISTSKELKGALFSKELYNESDTKNISVTLFSNGAALLYKAEIVQRAVPFFSEKSDRPILSFGKISLK